MRKLIAVVMLGLVCLTSVPAQAELSTSQRATATHQDIGSLQWGSVTCYWHGADADRFFDGWSGEVTNYSCRNNGSGTVSTLLQGVHAVTVHNCSDQEIARTFPNQLDNDEWSRFEGITPYACTIYSLYAICPKPPYTGNCSLPKVAAKDPIV